MNKDENWVIVPAFNEESTIQNVIRELREEGYNRIVVIDDCSTDKTYAKAFGLNPECTYTNMENSGQGYSLHKGIRIALENGAKMVTTFDGDGQHTASDIKKMQVKIEGGFDVVLGTRFQSKQSIPLKKRILLWGAIKLTRLFYGLKLTDTHNGIRCLSRKAAEMIEITSFRMEHASEIIKEIAKHKLKYVEVPVTIKYTDYSQRKGQSIFNAFIILWHMIKWKLQR